MRTIIPLAIGLLLPAIGVALAETARPIGERQIRRTLAQAFAGAPSGWQARLLPDDVMATCAKFRNQPPKDVADAIRAAQRRNIRYPADGNYVGDWRRGEEIAQSGYGLRFTDIQKGRPNGGNCYACHQLATAEVSYGTLGTSLKSYARTHGNDAAGARLVYEKIYNSQAVVACSLMPRFGANGILTIDQVKDLVALLLDPESPVNAASETPPEPSTAPKAPAPKSSPDAGLKPAAGPEASPPQRPGR